MDQQKFPTLVQREDAVVLGHEAPILAVRMRCPCLFASLQIHAREPLVAQMQIGVVADDHRCRHVPLQRGFPDRLGLELAWKPLAWRLISNNWLPPP